MHPGWARSLRDQCTAAGVPYFFKQWGAFAPDVGGHHRGGISVIDREGRNWERMDQLAPPDAVRMRRVGKGQAGRILDGRTWDEFPVAAQVAQGV